MLLDLEVSWNLTSFRVTCRSRPTHRDLRLDLIRGAALLCMHTDHFRHNELAGLTPRNFRILRHGRNLRLCLGLRVRCRLWNGVSGIRLPEVSVESQLESPPTGCGLCCHAACTGNGSMWFAQAWTPKIVELMTGIQTLRHIEGGSQVMGILLLYGVLLAALPAMLWLREWHWCVLLGPSVLLYGATQMDWTLVFAFGPIWRDHSLQSVCLAVDVCLGPPTVRTVSVWAVLGVWAMDMACAALVVIEGAFVCKCF